MNAIVEIYNELCKLCKTNENIVNCKICEKILDNILYGLI